MIRIDANHTLNRDRDQDDWIGILFFIVSQVNDYRACIYEWIRFFVFLSMIQLTKYCYSIITVLLLQCGLQDTHDTFSETFCIRQNFFLEEHLDVKYCSLHFTKNTTGESNEPINYTTTN